MTQTLLIRFVEQVDGGNIACISEDFYARRAHHIRCNLHPNYKERHKSQSMEPDKMGSVVVMLVRHEPMFEMVAQVFALDRFRHNHIVHSPDSGV